MAQDESNARIQSEATTHHRADALAWRLACWPFVDFPRSLKLFLCEADGQIKTPFSFRIILGILVPCILAVTSSARILLLEAVKLAGNGLHVFAGGNEFFKCGLKAKLVNLIHNENTMRNRLIIGKQIRTMSGE
jgi:hypothetical protein